jgi:hypothetical protein
LPTPFSPDPGVCAYRRPQSDRLFCLFTGGAAMLNINPVEFIHKTGVGHCNVLIFRDPYRAGYQRGISPDLPTLDAMVGWVGAQLAGPFSHVRDIFCVGTSGGGLPAVYVGHRRAARAVWSLGGRVARLSVAAAREKLADDIFLRVLGRTRPCPLTREERRKLREAVSAPELAERVQRVTSPDLLNDRELIAGLVGLVEQNQARTHFHFYYAITNPVDRTFAEAFRHCPGATLHPVIPPRSDTDDDCDPFNDPDHLVVPMLAAHGQLEGLFSEYLTQPA